MRQVAYNPLNRTQLVGEIGRETTITFGSEEQIVRVVFGQNPNDEIWDGPAAKEGGGSLRNNLPLWPMKTDATNLQVTTQLPDGSQRIYQFALSAVKPAADGSDDSSAIFGLIFTYPAEAHKAAIAEARARQVTIAATKAKARLASDVFYGTRNWSYVARPNKAWREAGWPKPEVSDNGEVTAFRFDGNVPSPAIYVVDTPKCGPGGHKRLAPFTDQGDLKVIKETDQHFRLRLGDAVMEVCNKAWNPVGQVPGTGTTSPDVVREVVSKR
jgi:type IV secretion system protein VirB9